ncbi:MAG: ABC transporter permease [Gemmatimonadetes bacterium]|nr:ABC transporter permease [Gemmatimonadota bacterium]
MRTRALPDFVVALLETMVADPVSRAGLIGDLEERYRLTAPAGRIRASAWLLGELFVIAYHYGFGRRMGMDTLRRDLSFAFRGLIARPGFSALVITTLALGIGANAAIFSVVSTLMVEPLPFEDADRLVIINEIEPSGFTASVAFPNYRDWRERNETFERFSIFLPSSRRFTTVDGARVLEVGWVMGGFFETLGVDPEVGRYFSEGESEPGAERLAVVSHRLWVDEWGADPSVIGSALTLNDEAFTIVGVTPSDFVLYDETDVYLPLGVVADGLPWDDRQTSVGAEIVARLAAGVPVERARADLQAIGAAVEAETGEEVDAANVTGLRAWFLGDTGYQSMMLMAAVSLLLLVACANVANLLFIASERRGGEMALRTALGASRGRIYRQLLTESMVLAVLGGIAGVALAVVGLNALLVLVADVLPPGFAGRIGMDAPVLLFAAALSLGTAVLAGFLPALRSARAELAQRIRSAAPGSVGHARGRHVLVATEMALSMVLLVGAGLLISTLARLQAVDKGFDGTGVLTFRVQTPGDTRETWMGFHETLRDELNALPGVTSVATSNHFPLAGNSWEMLYKDEGTPPGEEGESVLLTMVSASFFDTYDVAIAEGRGFLPSDRWGTEPVAIVDETLAAARWPGQSAIGKRVTFEQPMGPDGERADLWRTVVGVAAHVRHYELASPSRIEVYTPIGQSAAWGFTSYYSVKASVDPSSLVPAVRRVVARLDPSAPLYRIRAMEDIIADELGPQRAMRELLSAMAVLTLLLGSVGIYSVVSHGTALRRKELGLRIALGGAPSEIVALVLRDSMLPIGMGVVAGVVGAIALGRALRSVLYEVGPTDPVVLGSAAVILVTVGTVSAWLPARRAAHVDPQRVLREE